MISVNASRFPLAADADIAPAPPSPIRSADAVPGTAALDEVALSPAVASTLSDRSARISELKTIVNSPGYDAPPLPISRKLISHSLARSG